MSEPVLCYVDEPWAWFTSHPDPRDMWGDDWNDAPYEHNAGNPYEWSEGRGVPEYHLRKVAFDGPLETPASYAHNSNYSVQDINTGAVAWLRTDRYLLDRVEAVVILAGTRLSDFCRLVTSVGGHVYLEPA